MGIQILPPPTSLGTELGRSIGEGVTRGSDIEFQKRRTEKALEPLKTLSSSATPFELATALINASVANPEIGRSIGPLYQSLLESQQSRQKAESDALSDIERQKGLGAQNVPQGPLTREEAQTLLGERFFPRVQEQQPTKSPEGLRPQKPLIPPSPIGPAEESKIRKTLINRGMTNPAVLDEQISKIKQYQNDIYSAQKEGFSNIEEYQAAKKATDDKFFSESMLPLQASHGEMTPNEISIWKGLSRQFEDLPSSERYANTEQFYNSLVGDPLIQFEENQRGLPFGSFFRPEEIKSRMEDARTSVQDHLKRVEEREDLSSDLKGLIKNQLRNQYFNAMATKQFGIAQSAYAISDLSPRTAALIPKAPPPTETAFETMYLPDKKEREKYTYSLANALTKLLPEDSLILAREKALQNNYDDRSFNDALNLAINSGQLKLSDFQGKERNKLSIPQRLDLDSIMEGKRDIWDYFKGKK